MKNFFKVVGVVLLITVLGLLLRVGGLFGRAVTQPLVTAEHSADMAEDIVEDTLTSENAIREYEWFKQQLQDIKALGKKIERAQSNVEIYKNDLPDDKEKWSRSDKAELSRLRAIGTGLADMYDQAIADYDAKASMSHKAIFKDDLPADIFSAVKTGMELLGGN